MRIILDIQDHKAAFIMELLHSFPYLKTQAIAADIEPNSFNIEGNNDNTDFSKYIKPMRSFTIEDLVKEQDYRGVNIEQINDIRASLDLKNEPLNELLECIK